MKHRSSFVSRVYPTALALGCFGLASSCNNGVTTTSGHHGLTTASTGAGTGGSGGTSGTFGMSGGTLDTLSFAIVGDTRPANPNATSSYPTAIITKIWQDVQATTPLPPFAIATGDYQFSSTTGPTAGTQIDIYMKARAGYSGFFFPAMGNHECTGATASNCGPGGVDGTTANFTAFLTKMLGPVQQPKPYYEIDVSSTTAGAWTAKFVFVAANAWNSDQATWLDAALSKPTTYTFVVRHERTDVTDAPGVSPSNAIITKHPLTQLIVGHTHTYARYPSSKEIVVGNGGAPITGGVNYGYVLVHQRADAAIEFKSIDYMSGAAMDDFAVKADGTAAP